MTSTILNIIFDKFLTSFVEIDASKTDVSIFSGLIELNNLKIKSEIFQTYNIPYMELVHGYIGNLNIELKMPFFYDNPIKVKINKLFFHARQKNINKLQKEEELKNLLEYKKKLLLNTEQLFAQIDEIKRQNKENIEKKKMFAKDSVAEPSLVQKIINNLYIEVNKVVLRFDDAISYKDVPYCVGIVLNQIIVQSTRDNFNLPENLNEIIPFQEINYKVAIVNHFSIYMDCFDNEEDLDFEKLISRKVKNKVEEEKELKNYLKNQLKYYSYCMSELYVHAKHFNSHQYLLYHLDMHIKISLNSNAYNKKPQISAEVGFPQILLGLSLKQIRTALKVLAYINLNYLYQSGIAKEYFNRELKISEKKDYVDGYQIYFRNKYIKKEKIDFPSSLKYMEEHIHYDQISQMRAYALKKNEFVNKLEELENKINEEKHKYLTKNEDDIKRLEEEKAKIIKMEEIFNHNMFIKKSKIQEEEKLALEQDELSGLDDTYVKIEAKINIVMTSFTIYETVIYERNEREERDCWVFKDKLILILVQNLRVEGRIQKVGMIFLLTLDNTIISQEKIKNYNYNKIFFGDLTKEGNILTIIFEINPKLKKSDLRCKIWSEKDVYIILNTYTIQYIQYQILDVLSTTIDIEEYSLYAQESISKYIAEGVQDKLIQGNFSHSNIALDIFIKCPKIIIPIDVFDYTNTECILLSLGELKLKSVLPQRVELNPKIDYSKTKEEYLMYDIYRINLSKTQISTVKNCIEKYNYIGQETDILNGVDLTIECKILIQPKNPNFDNMIFNITLSNINFNMTEFQILLAIEFLGNYFKEGNRLQFEMEELKKEEEKRKEQKKEKIKEELKIHLKKKDKDKEGNKEEDDEKKKKKDLMEYNMRKKKANIIYQQYIKSFAISDNYRVNSDIKEIVTSKKSILVNVILKDVRFAIKKNYPDYTVEDYLVFEMKLLKVECDIAATGSLVVKVLVKDIALRDLNKDEKKREIINPQFQCLIKSAQENQGVKLYKKDEYEDDKNIGFVDYQLLIIGDELNNLVNINDLHITASLESLLHMYQFSMYYVGVYLNTMNDIEIIKNREMENIIKKEIGNEKELNEIKLKSINDENFAIIQKYYLHKFDLNYLNDIKRKTEKSKNKKIWKDIKSFEEYIRSKEYKSGTNKKEAISSERKRSILKVLVTMNNTRVELPFNPLKLNEPIFKLKFNLIYNQKSTSVYTDFFTLPSKKIIGTFYESNTSSMNTSVSNCDFDMVYYLKYKKKLSENLPEDRLLSNFRMACLIDSFIALNSEQNVMIIDVNTEPILFAFGMRQFKKSWSLYEKSMNYLKLMFEKYIPYARPGQEKISLKKKSLKYIIKKVIRRQHLKRSIEKKMQLSKREKIVNKIINTDKFNSLLITNVKSDKIGFIFFDNTHIGEKNILLDIRMKKLVCKYLQNSKIRDKENISNALYEMITGDEVPQNKYNRNTLSMYYFVFFSVNANYYNLVTNNFEPIVEKFETSVEMMQVAPFFRAKTFVIINDMININLSADSIIAFNSFMLRYTQDEENWDPPKELIDPLRWRSTVKYTIHEINEMTRKDEIVLQFINYTGINLILFFDSYVSNKIPLKPKEIVSFTSNNLYRARGLHRHKNKVKLTTFSVVVNDCYPMEKIDYKRTNYRYYKLFVELIHNKYVPIFFNIRVESRYNFNKISFCSSFSFYNNSKFYKITIVIKNKSIEEKSIVIPRDSRDYIPLTWFMCQKPDSSIYIKFADNDQLIKICDHPLELISKSISDEDLKAKEDLKKKMERESSKSDNPKFKKIMEIKKSKIDNIENNRSIEFIFNEKKHFLNLDLFVLKSKKQSLIREKKNNEKKNKEGINNNTNNNILDSSLLSLHSEGDIPYPEDDYEYCLYVRPSFRIVNKLPFTLYFIYKDKEVIIETLGKEDIYEFSIDSVDNEICIKIDYYGILYKSENFKLNDIEYEKYIDLTNENNTLCLKCHILKNPLQNEIKKPRSYFLEKKSFSIKTYEILFFFDYIINNRTTKSLWICPCRTKMKKLKEVDINMKKQELKPSTLHLLSFPDYEPQFSIKDESSNWSFPFNMNTVGIEGVIELDNIINNTYSLKTINEIAVILSTSDLYDFSIIIIFEPKYVIINNLGFDIVYKQENNSLNREYPLKTSEFQAIKYEKIDKFFRIGIYDEINHLTNYSGMFNIENNEDIDIKIKVNPNNSFLNNKDFKIFSYDAQDYYILIRVINHSYDNGTVFILLCHPLFPYLEIVNNTKLPIKINEESSDLPLIINNPNVTSFPFTWENPAKYKDELKFEIYGVKENFSFSVFNIGIIKIKEKDLSFTYSISSKNKTETRSFKIEKTKLIDQAELDLSRMFLKRSKLNSSTFDVYIKGFGLSLISQENKEIFYISFYNIRVKYITNIHKANSGTSTTTMVNYIAFIENFQVDYCLNDSLRTIISPILQIVPSNESKIKRKMEKRDLPIVPFMGANVTTKTTENLISNEKLTSYEVIELALQKFEMKIEQNELINLLKMYNEFMKLFDYYTINIQINRQEKDKEELLDVELPIPIKKLMKENENSVRQLIKYLALSSLKLELTIRLDTKPIEFQIPILIDRILGSIFSALGRISNCPLKFKEQIIEKVYMSWYDLSWKIINPYITQGIVQIYKILGSLDIIGNPVNLINNITEGVSEFVLEPGKGMKKRNVGLGIGGGIAKGIGGLASGVVGGAFDSLQRISTTLLVSVQTIAGRERKDILFEEENEPKNALSGLYQGITGFGSEIGRGVYNLFTQPCSNYSANGISGFCSGLCKGLLGFALCPVTAALKLVSSISAGIKNSCFGLSGRKRLKTERFRYPRIIVEGGEKLESYDEDKAEAKELLFILNKENTDNILYSEDFICANKGFERKFSTVILTDKSIYVIYDTQKIIFEENLRNINYVLVHFIDNKYVIIFKLLYGKSRGFFVNKDYPKIPTEIFDLIVPYLRRVKTMLASTKTLNLPIRSFLGQIQKRADENDDNSIDDSSYNNTVSINTYNSLKTLNDKL